MLEVGGAADSNQIAASLSTSKITIIQNSFMIKKKLKTQLSYRSVEIAVEFKKHNP